MKHLALLFLLVAPLWAEIIPAARRTPDWSKAGVHPDYAATAGVAGASVGKHPNSNIPNRTFISTNVLDYGAVADDATDNGPAFQAALNATVAGGVMWIPAGVYKFTSSNTFFIKRLSNLTAPFNNGVTIRGAGIGQTILHLVGEISSMQFRDPDGGMQADFASYSTGINSGATVGSTSIVVADRMDGAWWGALAARENVTISEINDPALVSNVSHTNVPGTQEWNYHGWPGVPRHRGQTVKVLTVTPGAGTTATVTFEPALYSTFTDTPALTRNLRRPVEGNGVESLTLYSEGPNAPRNGIAMETSRNCWVYDVRSDFGYAYHVNIEWSMWNTIQKCHFYESFLHTAGDDNQIGIRKKSSANLVMDCIVERLHTSFIVDDGATGNVVAYNLAFREYDEGESGGNRILQMGINSSHGCHGQFNLFEGNFAQRFVADDFWGTSSDNTVALNFFSGTGTSHSPYNTRSGSPGSPYALTVYRRAIDLWWGQSRYNVVGNILGDASMSDATFKAINSTVRDQSGKYIWQLDYWHNNYTGDDPVEYPAILLLGPRASPFLIDHGNYDPVNATQTWDAGIADHDIPHSYFLTEAQLAAFTGLAEGQKVFDPATAGSTTDLQKKMRLPAYVRWLELQAPTSYAVGRIGKLRLRR